MHFNGDVHPMVSVYLIVHAYVFEQRQQGEYRQHQPVVFFGHFDRTGQFSLKPHFHHMHERSDKGQFFPQRYKPPFIALQDITENIRQFRYIKQGMFIVAFPNQGGYAVE